MENMGCWHITESASIYIYRLKRPLREWPLVDKLSHCLTNQLGDPTHRDYIQRIPEKCRLVTQDFYGWMLSTWPPWYPDFSTGHTLHQSNIGIEHGGFILGNYLLRVVISHIYVSLWGGNPTKKGGVHSHGGTPLSLDVFFWGKEHSNKTRMTGGTLILGNPHISHGFCWVIPPMIFQWSMAIPIFQRTGAGAGQGRGDGQEGLSWNGHPQFLGKSHENEDENWGSPSHQETTKWS